MTENDVVHCLVEIPKGSRNKYEWNEELGSIVFDRFLFSSVVYPLDYGMIPHTLAADGDPLDVMVAVSEPTFPGCIIPIRPVALFKMSDDKGIDDKVIGVPLSDPNWSHVERLEDFPAQLCDEISHFFEVYKTLEQKDVKVDGWYPREAALAVIEESQRAWHRRHSNGVSISVPKPAKPANAKSAAKAEPSSKAESAS